MLIQYWVILFLLLDGRGGGKLMGSGSGDEVQMVRQLGDVFPV